LRIVLLTDFFYPRFGGIATHVEGLAKTLRDLGHEVFIITTAGETKDFDDYEGIPVFRRKSRILAPVTFGMRAFRRRIRPLIEALDPDLMHAHHPFSPLGIATPRIGKELGIPTVITNHFTPPFFREIHFWWYGGARILSKIPPTNALKMYTRAISVNPIGARFFSYVYRKKVYYIPNAIYLKELEAFDPKKEVDPESPVMLLIGRGSPRKGFELAFLAFKYVLVRYPKAKMLIIGPTGFTYNYLEKWARLLKIRDNVRFLGYIPRRELFKIYQKADLLINTSYGGESFPMIFLEALALGVPIVSTVGGALKRIFSKSGAGVFLGKMDHIALAGAIINLLKNPEKLEEMRMRGRAFVRRYDWHRIIKQVFRVYNEALNEL